MRELARAANGSWIEFGFPGYIARLSRISGGARWRVVVFEDRYEFHGRDEDRDVFERECNRAGIALRTLCAWLQRPWAGHPDRSRRAGSIMARAEP